MSLSHFVLSVLDGTMTLEAISDNKRLSYGSYDIASL